MRTEIESMLNDLMVECDEVFAVSTSFDDDVCTAILFATNSPMMPLFDRRGELQLSGKGATVSDALDALNARCAIR